MSNRACPMCSVKIPRSFVLTRENLLCPSCHTPLELSRMSRGLCATLGVFAAAWGAYLFFDLNASADWVLPVVGSVFSYGIASALVLFFVADLVVQPKPPTAHFPQARE